jgi:hypothetical protein
VWWWSASSFGPGWRTAAAGLRAALVVFGAPAAYFALWPSAPLWILVVVVPVWGLGSMFVCLLCSDVRRSEQKRAQRWRDSHAREIAASVAASTSHPPYYLWLRPFTSSGHVRIVLRSAMVKRVSPNTTTHDYPGFGPTTQLRRDVHWGDLESLFAAMLESRGPLVALGRASDEIGAGRVPTNEASWQATFDILAEASLAILLLPSTHPGTDWEMQRILSEDELLQKSIFVVPHDASWVGTAGLGSTFAPGATGPHSAESTVRDDALHALGNVLAPGELDELFGLDDGGLMTLRPGERATVEKLVRFKKENYLALNLAYGPATRISYRALRSALHDLVP